MMETCSPFLRSFMPLILIQSTLPEQSEIPRKNKNRLILCRRLICVLLRRPRVSKWVLEYSGLK